MTIKQNHLIFKIANILFLLFWIKKQIQYFNEYLLNPGGNGDETGYVYYVTHLKPFNFSVFSSTPSQPYFFLCSSLNVLIKNPRFTNRITTMIITILFIIFLVNWCLKKWKIDYLPDQKFWNILFLVNIIGYVVTIITIHYTGTPDIFSTALGTIGILIWMDAVNRNEIKNIAWLGFLFGLSITTRPTFLAVGLVWAITFFFLYKDLRWNRNIWTMGIVTVITVLIINIVPIINEHKIILDDKEPRENSGAASWFEMNYLMAKKWDAGEIPRTQWLSSDEVIAYKKNNSQEVFPKNQFEVLKFYPGLYFRQMIRMTIVSIYSSFRYLLFIFPFLICCFWFRKKWFLSRDQKIIIWLAFGYFGSLLLFEAKRIKLMEMRWMLIPLIIAMIYGLYFLRKIPEKARWNWINATLMIGIIFFIANEIKYLILKN
jgi:hypothetical protein